MKSLRRATRHDRQRFGEGGGTCGEQSKEGWCCSLKYRHRGNHQAWAIHDADNPGPTELCHEWPRARRSA